MDTASLINVYVFPTGRRIYALTEVQKRAAARGVATVAAHAGRAVAHDRQTLVLEQRRQDSRDGFYGDEVQAIDTVLDRALIGLDTYLESQVQVLTKDSARGSAAATVGRTLFPHGATAITQLSFIQQNSQVDALLARLTEPDVSAAVSELPELTPMIERIRELNAQYGSSLAAYERNLPTIEELRASQLRGQEFLAETVALILAHYIAVAPGDTDGRQDLLEPIMRQNTTIRTARQHRRVPRDVDPDTGIEIPPSARAGQLASFEPSQG